MTLWALQMNSLTWKLSLRIIPNKWKYIVEISRVVATKSFAVARNILANSRWSSWFSCLTHRIIAIDWEAHHRTKQKKSLMHVNGGMWIWISPVSHIWSFSRALYPHAHTHYTLTAVAYTNPVHKSDTQARYSRPSILFAVQRAEISAYLCVCECAWEANDYILYM